MKISNKKTLKEAQQIFSFIYPGLRLEIYFDEYSFIRDKALDEYFCEYLKIEDFSQSNNYKCVYFESDVTTINKFISDFKNKFGLYIKIFRRSRSKWVELSSKDTSTLEVQNLMGTCGSEFFKKELLSA